MASLKLRPPEWQRVPEYCPGCSYALTGLSPPGTCPECGLAFDEHTLVMIGIPRRGSSTSPIRRVLWGVVIAVGAVWSNLVGFLLIFEPAMLLLTGVLWIGGAIALLATGKKRERSATQPIIFTSGGFGLASDEHTDAGAVFSSWENVNGFNLKRLGPNWYRLQLGKSPFPNPTVFEVDLASVKFQAGVCCTEEQAHRVRPLAAAGYGFRRLRVIAARWRLPPTSRLTHGQAASFSSASFEPSSTSG